jgi:hypothetical protein
MILQGFENKEFQDLDHYPKIPQTVDFFGDVQLFSLIASFSDA